MLESKKPGMLIYPPNLLGRKSYFIIIQGRIEIESFNNMNACIREN